ncbi:hypothetical protein M8C13_31115 [Crossiella sp. SN42]|uniref:hypothetical protein n=1 Tax=Crossiella sp. SN42 TaxID=2944808 RepID=UPI00207C8E30|nr:hypothetical protein [Crossiella sp. SN42]MCO1580215.1 hypothetical protein [Crossiella sp. SN42]
MSACATRSVKYRFPSPSMAVPPTAGSSAQGSTAAVSCPAETAGSSSRRVGTRDHGPCNVP